MSNQDNAAAVVIPYKNAPALIGYYLGIFSLIPCLGGVLALGAIPLGIVGLRNARANPQAHGTAHALVAIIIGSIVLLAHVGILALMVFAN
jgi:hypothetical protein